MSVIVYDGSRLWTLMPQLPALHRDGPWLADHASGIDSSRLACRDLARRGVVLPRTLKAAHTQRSRRTG